MKSFKKHLCLFICLVLCMSVLPAGFLFAQATDAPIVTVDNSVATLDFNGIAKVNKLYVGYMGTSDPGDVSTWSDYSAKKESHICVQNPADGSEYLLKNVGYYTILVNYNVGNRDYDVYFTFQNSNEPGSAEGKPVVSNAVVSNNAVLSYGSAYTVKKVYYGYIGETETPYTNYYDFVATCPDRICVQSPANEQAFGLSKAGYYRFIVNYTDGIKEYDAIYTLKNEVAAQAPSVPVIAVNENTVELDYNGVSSVNKVYVGYMGVDNPGEISNWDTYKANVKNNVCTTAPADKAQFELKNAGYYVILINYTSASVTKDVYYPVQVEGGSEEEHAVPSVSAVANTNEAAVSFNGATQVNKVCYGYIGTEETEYNGYDDYVANATGKVVDRAVTDGKTYAMSKMGYYRFIVNYTFDGKDYDAIYTISNNAGVPVISEDAGTVTVDYNGAGTVEKMYVGYMGTTNPGTIADWTTYTEKNQSSTRIASPEDGFKYYITGKTGFYTFVVNYTTNGINADAYFTIEVNTVFDANYGKPYVTQLTEGGKEVELSLNNAHVVNKVYYGYIGTENYDYVDYYDYVDKATNRQFDGTPTEGEVYTLGDAGYYRFIINYSDAKGRNYDAVYTVCVELDESEELSEVIYSELEFIITDMEELEELESLELDAKGQAVYAILKEAVYDAYSLKDDGVILSKDYVRNRYSSEISEIATIVKSMTVEERDAFEVEMGKFNPAAANNLVNIFDVNINFGK